MNIVIKYFSNTEAMAEKAKQDRAHGTLENIEITIKRADAATGIALSSSFDERAINRTYCRIKNIEVVTSEIDYGNFGNVLSVPNNTFALYIPLKKDGFDIFCALSALTDVLKNAPEFARSGNDFISEGKKMMGMWVSSNYTQIVAIGSLYGFNKEIDNIYTDYFTEKSGKSLPSKRSVGISTQIPNISSVLDLANALKDVININEDIIDKIIVEN